MKTFVTHFIQTHCAHNLKTKKDFKKIIIMNSKKLYFIIVDYLFLIKCIIRENVFDIAPHIIFHTQPFSMVQATRGKATLMSFSKFFHDDFKCLFIFVYDLKIYTSRVRFKRGLLSIYIIPVPNSNVFLDKSNVHSIGYAVP